MQSWVTAICLLSLATAAAASEDRGVFSAKSVSLQSVYERGPPVTVTSPDGRSKATAIILHPERDDGRFVVSVRGRLGSGRFEIAYGPNAELLWAPDSKALFVTGDDGGLVGTYELQVIQRVGGRLRSRDLSPLLARAYGQPVRCFSVETPNVAGVAWLGSSRRLLAAVETPAHSNCDSFGTFALFEVDSVAMKVVHRFDQLKAKATFGPLLGEELVGADDDCARKPSTCWIPQLHPEPGFGPTPNMLAEALAGQGVRRPMPVVTHIECAGKDDPGKLHCLWRQPPDKRRWGAFMATDGRNWTLNGRPDVSPGP